jgi:PIN domain nuclease of toxin-antitoxin system
MKTNGLLLDTCAVIWLSHGEPVARQAIDRIRQARQADQVIGVSIMSAWELGMLVSKGRLPSVREPRRWFDEFIQVGKATIAEVTSRILVDASFLPVPVHNDPTDRIIIATARERDLAIVTRDRAILAYADQGHVQAVPC